MKYHEKIQPVARELCTRPKLELKVHVKRIVEFSLKNSNAVCVNVNCGRLPVTTFHHLVTLNHITVPADVPLVVPTYSKVRLGLVLIVGHVVRYNTWYVASVAPLKETHGQKFLLLL